MALTAPYFHDGSVATLKEAVALMGQSQAGRTLDPEDVNDITAFLESLSSEFFAGMGQGMSQENMQNSMRQQMPDRMQQRGGAGPMSGDNHQRMMQMQGIDHQQHMKQMRSMQNQQTDQPMDHADHSQHEEH